MMSCRNLAFLVVVSCSLNLVHSSGPVILANGSIDWGDELPQPEPYKTKTDYQPGGLSTLFSMTRGWVVLVSKELDTGK